MLSTGRKAFFIISFCCLAFSGIKAITNIDLYLNRGDYTAVDSTIYPYLSFNSDPVFEPQNRVINVELGDTIAFVIHNTDSLSHSFNIKGYGFAGGLINPQDSLLDTVVFDVPGLFVYHDDYPNNSYLGAAGMILVEQPNNFAHFYWNFKEQQDDLNRDLVNGQSPNWNAYTPNYFTVNGRSKPDVPNDPSAVVVGNVGDTIRIQMANTGRSVHSIHFHGYHCRIAYSSQDSRMRDWSKDSFPLKSMETMILELVPDKPGDYPVHDHNLVAVSGGGIYPKGMFMMMHIN